MCLVVTRLVCVLALFCGGCTSLSPTNHFSDKTVEDFLDNPAFRAQNLPMRTLKIAVLADPRLSEETVRRAFADASHDLSMQVGIAIKIVWWGTETLPNNDSSAVFRRLRALCPRVPAHEIAIGITLEEAGQEEWVGDMRIIGRANHLFHSIHLRSLRRHVILHEIGHLLLGPLAGHSQVGVMHERAVTPFFSLRDRSLVLERKWGDLSACWSPAPRLS